MSKTRPHTAHAHSQALATNHLALLVLSLLVSLSLLLLPLRMARANENGSVSYDACRIVALLDTKGDLNVLECWTITYVGTWYGTEWAVDTTDADAYGVDIQGAGEVVDGRLVPYDEALDEQVVPGTYHTAGYNSKRTCTLHYERGDETIEVYLSFVLRGAARRWRDAGTLDWQFLNTPDTGVGDVAVDLYVERPEEGGVWPGENVFCWRQVGNATFEVTDIEDAELADAPFADALGATSGHAAHAHVRLGGAPGSTKLTVFSLLPEEWLHKARSSREKKRIETLERMRWNVGKTADRTHEQSSLWSITTAAVLIVLVALGIAIHLHHAKRKATSGQDA